MYKGLLTGIVALFLTSAVAEDFMEFGSKNFKADQFQKSSWVFSLGYSYLEWDTVMPEYDGSFDDIADESTSYMSGVNLDFGRQFYVSSNFSATLKIILGYHVSLEEITSQAAKDLDLDLAELDVNHEIFTGEVALSLGYLYETELVGIQPFAEFSLGTGTSRVDRDYKYDGLTGSADVPNKEHYKVVAEESFLFSKASVGVTFIGWKGITSYIKLSAMTVNKTEREFSGSYKTQSGAETSVDEKFKDLDDTETLVTGSLGFGYLF
jgi:hypothetical protein